MTIGVVQPATLVSLECHSVRWSEHIGRSPNVFTGLISEDYLVLPLILGAFVCIFRSVNQGIDILGVGG